MKIIDMSHVMNVHTPGWVGYAGNRMYYAQNLQTQMIVAQRIETALHVGTHFDGAMHATDDPKGDMASLPLDYLVNRGIVVDISGKMSDWAVITPEIIESAGAEIREGDILLLHTGWHRHYEGRPQQDLVKYFCFHPGPNLDTLHWMLKKKIKWWGMDTGSCDHAMNTSIRTIRPDPAGGEDIGVAMPERIECIDDRFLLIADHPHFLEIDADRSQTFRDIADVLVLGAAGQDLATDHQERGRDNLFGSGRVGGWHDHLA